MISMRQITLRAECLSGYLREQHANHSVPGLVLGSGGFSIIDWNPWLFPKVSVLVWNPKSSTFSLREYLAREFHLALLVSPRPQPVGQEIPLSVSVCLALGGAEVRETSSLVSSENLVWGG